MRNVTSIILLALVGIGCNEYQVIDDGKGIDDLYSDDVPDILVNPSSIDFGQIEVNDGIEHVQVVEVQNVGDADLLISAVELDDSTAPYTVTAIVSPLVPAGSSTQFEVVYEPETAATSNNVVYIDSNDPDTPTAEVLLIGQGIAPIIEVTPTTYDFGTLWVGCENVLPVEISNIGTADLIVYSYDYFTGSNDLIFENPVDQNGGDEGLLTLEPSETFETYISYLPLDEYEDVAYLAVESNDPFRPTIQVDQTGTAEYYGLAEDIFEQPIQSATDIIFAVDRSGSMGDDIANVQTNFATFVSTLAGMDADYHVAATVEDNGCINGSDIWIDNTFTGSEAQSVITTQINYGHSYGSNTERAFMLLESCLSETGSGGCNDGLVREDAKLNLVGVSDEPEQSVNSYATYVALFQGYKSDTDNLVMHAIGGDYPSGCSSASAYTGFYEATVATGGLFLSICATDWASHLELLAEGSAASLDSFELTGTPVPETITVKVDGVTTTVGWSYEASSNAVKFQTDYIPDGGATIQVNYALYGDCDA